MKHIKNKGSTVNWSLLLILAFCQVMIPAFLQAKEIEEQQVRSAVETWVRHVTADARPDAVIERMEPHKVDGETVAYIAHLEGGGFCLCGPDDLVLPVYFYSPHGTYDPQNKEYQYFLWEIDARLKCTQEALQEGDPKFQPYQEALSERAAFWEDLSARRVPPKKEEEKGDPTRMSLDLNSHWDQGSPYNDQCPELTPVADEHTAVGCVATAMSQIMYYWKWPNTGVGTGTTVYPYRWRTNWDEEPLANDPGIPGGWGARLQWTAAGGGRLSMNGYWDSSVYEAAENIDDDANYRNALQTLWNRLNQASTNCNANFGATTYDWSILEDTHADPPGSGDAEVAELCYHAGIAVQMDYGVRGSSASTSDVDDALEDHFRYDLDATYGARNIDAMTADIQWLRPLQYRAGDPVCGGHSWFVYGYDKSTDPNRQFLMNLGWGGNGDGWYSCDQVDVLNQFCQAIPDGVPDLVVDQAHVTRIAPQNVVRFVGATNTGDGTPDDPYEDIEEALAEAADGTTLIFKAGSVNTFSTATLAIDRPLTLKGYNVIIQKQ